MGHQGPVQTHGPAKCAGDVCCIHNPSDHHMVGWPLNFRFDKYDLAERVCVHGVGHPDPDSYAYIVRELVLVHGMDAEEATFIGVHGCCRCCQLPESQE
jgi:hypothetical protein